MSFRENKINRCYDVTNDVICLTSETVVLFCSVVRVGVGEFDISTRCQQFAVLQPDEVRFRDACGCAAEHSTAPCWSGDRLRPLHKLWRSCRETGTCEDREIIRDYYSNLVK